jgi:hypothetical protein
MVGAIGVAAVLGPPVVLIFGNLVVGRWGFDSVG